MLTVFWLNILNEELRMAQDSEVLLAPSNGSRLEFMSSNSLSWVSCVGPSFHLSVH